MPTIDFIRETVEDRFYERGGEPPRAPRPLTCPECGAELENHAQLTEHVGSAHPLAQPRLLINGEVVVKRRTLHRRLQAGALTTTNTTELIVSQNGRPSVPDAGDARAGALER